MWKKTVTLFSAVLFCSTIALAQQQTKAPAPENAYSVARESGLTGTVASYTAASTTPPAGAQLQLQTSTGTVNVHLGNARLLRANHMTLQPGDSVTIVGETLPSSSGGYYAARLIQKGPLVVTLRSRGGVPLVVVQRTSNGQQTAAGAR